MSEEWRDISTAPEEDIFLICSIMDDPDEWGFTIQSAWLEPIAEGGIYVDGGVEPRVTPTHWLPLPQPPVKK